MKTAKYKSIVRKTITWEESSGFLQFLSSVPDRVRTFNQSFEFCIENLSPLPLDIDGDTEIPLQVGFVLKRNNLLLPELQYCLYSVLKEKMLYGYIGLYRNGSLTTLKELKPIRDFHKGEAVLHGWLTQLVRASCEKITL
ncbi:MAG: hypothetical protein AMK70_04150 [Nitrospira bacterium SG8_35_1]|nr:MAG: hypothetical protein AMK70_04150 [Nitrospira bacterium SG8_35_1]